MKLNDWRREAERFADIDRAVCASCGNTGLDLESREPCSQCPIGAALRDELRQFDEPCYGACARCPRQGEVWYIIGEWLCESCKERA